MEDRGFTEVDLRAMLLAASGTRADPVEGRFVIETWHAGARWSVIVEPERQERLLIVVMAYKVG